MPRMSLLNIPEKVFKDHLFLMLRINDVLRLRRVCKTTKKYSEDYLRLHSRSQRLIWIDLHGLTDWPDDNDYSSVNWPVEPFKSNFYVPLKTFLEEDSKNTIRMPGTRFRLSYKYSVALNLDVVDTFLERYAGQIEHLELSNTRCPLNESEIGFIAKLPKLTSLKIKEYSDEPHRAKDGWEYPDLRNLKKLEIPDIDHFNFLSPRLTLDYLRYFCGKLEYLCVSSDLVDEPKHVKELFEILGEKKDLKFKFGIPETKRPRWNNDLTHFFSNKVIEGRVKLVDMDSEILLKLGGFHLMQVARQTLSLKNYWVTRDNLAGKCVAFPNLEEMEIIVTKMPERSTKWKRSEVEDILQQSLSPKIFPGLKKLKVRLPLENGSAKVLSLVWKNVSNLEEVVFTENAALEDVAFIGVTGDCPFLKLAKLEKLDLGDLSGESLTDTIFSDLKKLKIRLPPKNGAARALSMTWLNAPHLKEVERVQVGSEDGNVPFAGVTKDCLFINLTELAKPGSRDKITDAVFHQVCRNMRLRELRMLSLTPLESVTSNGIRALLTGPFGKSIEQFSFRGWSLADMPKDEFLKLSFKFPGNQGF